MGSKTSKYVKIVHYQRQEVLFTGGCGVYLDNDVFWNKEVEKVTCPHCLAGIESGEIDTNDNYHHSITREELIDLDDEGD